VGKAFMTPLFKVNDPQPAFTAAQTEQSAEPFPGEYVVMDEHKRPL
jgi:hypothetical protein